MDLAALRSLVREVNFGIHGVAAVVAVPDAPPVATRVVWLPPISDPVPIGGDMKRIQPRRVMAIRRDEVPSVPRGTLIDVAEHLQEEPALWTVDATDAVETAYTRVIVVPTP